MKQLLNKTIKQILLGDVSKLDLRGIDLLIVGAMTGNGSKDVIPQKNWIPIPLIQDGQEIILKSNILKYVSKKT